MSVYDLMTQELVASSAFIRLILLSRLRKAKMELHYQEAKFTENS